MAKFDFNEIAERAKREAAKYKVGKVNYQACADMNSGAQAYKFFDTIAEAQEYLRSMWKFYLNEGKDFHIVDMYINVHLDIKSLDSLELRQMMSSVKNQIIHAQMIQEDFWNFTNEKNRGLIDYLKAKREEYLKLLTESVLRGKAYVYVIKHTLPNGDFAYIASLFPRRSPDGEYSIEDTFVIRDDTYNDEVYTDHLAEDKNYTLLELCEYSHTTCDDNENDIWWGILKIMTE